MSNHRPVETVALSDAFKDEARNFSYTARWKPAVVIVRPRDGVWGIDAEPEGPKDNQILMDLGKSMERMLTMNRSMFKRLMIKSPSGECAEIPTQVRTSVRRFQPGGRLTTMIRLMIQSRQGWRAGHEHARLVIIRLAALSPGKAGDHVRVRVWGLGFRVQGLVWVMTS